MSPSGPGAERFLADLDAVGDEAEPLDPWERALRMELLQAVEPEYEPLAFDDAAARCYGRIAAATAAVGRAAVAGSSRRPLYTTNPGDFAGLDGLVRIVPVDATLY